MDFEIAVVCLLVILYIIAIITVFLLVYMCLKVKSNTSSHRSINTHDTYLDNREETTQTIQTTSNIEGLLGRSTKSETSIKSDSTGKSEESHIYQEIEDLYIDDSIPSNLDSKCKNDNFPEPFYFALDPESQECSCEGACLCKKHLYH